MNSQTTSQILERSTFATPGALGVLVDQALDKILYHQSEARRLRALADEHEAQVTVHRRILSSFEILIPGGGP